MIPQERVNEAAKADYKDGYVSPHYAGFLHGVRFAEAELKRMQSCSTCHVTEVITDGICNVCGAEQNITKQ